MNEAIRIIVTCIVVSFVIGTVVPLLIGGVVFAKWIVYCVHPTARAYAKMMKGGVR